MWPNRPLREDVLSDAHNARHREEYLHYDGHKLLNAPHTMLFGSTLTGLNLLRTLITLWE